MKIVKSKAMDRIGILLVNICRRHRIDEPVIAKQVDQILNGQRAYIGFGDSSIWATECNVSVWVEDRSLCEEIGAKLGRLSPRAELSWGGTNHSISEAVVCLENYKKALAFAAEIDAALGGIEIVKD